jgi:hypothetical protein
MSVVFPNSNLPTSSQPWGREVTKQLSNIIASSTSAQINNAARDNQLNSSIIALNGVVTEVQAATTAAQTAADDAQDAINGLIGLGSSGSPYSIFANNISGGTITGITIQSAASGTRVVMESSDLEFYYNSTYVGKIQGNDNSWTSDAALTLESSTGGSIISLEGSGVSIYATSSGNGISVTNSENISYGNFRATGQLTSNGLIQSGGNMRSGGVLGRIELVGGGTTGASINDNGNLIRTTSSERYKQDIENLSVNYDEVLSLQPKRFRLKDEVSEHENARYYAGFIAEEIDQTSLKDFIAYQTLEDGSRRPDGVYYGELTTVLLEAIKHQDKLIKSLNDRITELEKGA